MTNKKKYLWVLGLIGIVVIMIHMNWQLALVSVISLPILAWRSIVTSRRLRPIWQEIQQNQAIGGVLKRRKGLTP